MAPGAQADTKGPQERGVVVDDEDFGHRRYRPIPLLGVNGSVNTKRAPAR